MECEYNDLRRECLFYHKRLSCDDLHKLPQILKIQGLSKRYGDQEVLRLVDWTLVKGSKTLLKGANGSGKTTLFKILTTLIRPTSGSIEIDGRSIWSDPIRARHSFSYLSPDERSFYWRLSARRNLLFFGTLQRLSEKESPKRFEPLAEKLGILDVLTRPFQEFSSGMRQKLALVRALMLDRPLYLLDEPERHLDGKSVDLLKSLLEEKTAKGAAVLVATATDGFHLGGPSFRLENGKIQEETT